VHRTPMQMVEGIIDLAFAEATATGRSWTVVDFKTDPELSQTSDAYAAQVRLYGRRDSHRRHRRARERRAPAVLSSAASSEISTSGS